MSSTSIPDHTEEMRHWLTLMLYEAFNKAKKGKLNTVNEQRFEEDRELELIRLVDDVIGRTYKPSRSVAFITHKPVPREIFAAPFRDRVIHHFLIMMNGDFWDNRLSSRSFSCRDGKGTLYGIRTLEKDIRNVTKQWSEDAWVMKIDLQGYFMSLPRKYLFERVCWGLDRQFPQKGPTYDICKYLWKQIIFDNPTVGVRIKGSLSDWDILPPSKSMFNSKPGHGIVIGNLTSQWVSNMALDPLDRFVKFDLGINHYGRYVDDAYFVAATKQELLDIRPKVEEFITNLGLVVHPKKFFLQPANYGVPFLGVVVYPGYIVLGKRFRANMKQVSQDIRMDGLSIRNTEKIKSYKGLTMHYKHQKVLNDMFGKGVIKRVL